MPLTIDTQPTGSLVRVEGDFTVTSALELKAGLLEALACTQPLEVDLAHAQEIDVSLLQLLWSAAREIRQPGAPLVRGVSEAAARAAREAGFERFPGTGEAGVGRG